MVFDMDTVGNLAKVLRWRAYRHSGVLKDNTKQLFKTHKEGKQNHLDGARDKMELAVA